MDDKEVCEKRLGTTLRNKWTLEKLLGVGGMAAVYVGVHKIGRREAIKILHPDAARSNDMRARFEQEAYAVNQLGHPGAVEIRDIDTTEDGAPFLVMELLEGEPLSERSQRLGTIETDEMLRFIDELLDVLVAAHAQGIIHRDIKPDNLFVLHDGRLKVLDFGIAHMRSGASLQLKTRYGAKLGTTPYMPPEQVKGFPIDGRADLFAVGATMFRLVAKRRIHEAKTEPEMMLLMASTPAPPLASAAPDAPIGVCQIVDRALAFNRQQRYPDAATMQGDVRAVRRGEPPPYAAAKIAEGNIPNISPPPDMSPPSTSDPGFADKPTYRPPKPDATAPASVDADESPTVITSRPTPPTMVPSRASAITRLDERPTAPPAQLNVPLPVSAALSGAYVAPASAIPSGAYVAPASAIPSGAYAVPGPTVLGDGPMSPASAAMSGALLQPASTPMPHTHPPVSRTAPGAAPLAITVDNAPPAPSRRMSRRMSIMTIVALLVLTLAGAGLGWTLRGSTVGPPAPSSTPSISPERPSATTPLR